MRLAPKLFIDTNVILNFILRREGWEYVGQLIDLSIRQELRCYCSYLSVADIAYIVRKSSGAEGVRRIIKELLSWCEVLSPSSQDISTAIKLRHPDFEDALQILCAEMKGCDAIITRNLKHFEACTEIPAICCEALISKMKRE